MNNKNITELVQKEIDEKQQNKKTENLIGILHTAGIGAIAVLGLIGSQPFNIQENSDDALKIASSIALITWGYMRTLNMKLNSENRLIYHVLNKHEETSLSPIENETIIKNVGVAGITFISSCFAILLPVLAAGSGKMPVGKAAFTGSLILIANEIFLKHMFKKNNQILKNNLPQGVCLNNACNQRGV